MYHAGRGTVHTDRVSQTVKQHNSLVTSICYCVAFVKASCRLFAQMRVSYNYTQMQ